MPYNLRIPGQYIERELWTIEALAQLVPPGGVVVEVGSSLGLSSYTWAKSVDPSVTIYCIDVWENNPEDAQKLREKYQTDYSLENFRSFTKKCPNIVTLQGFSPQDFTEWDQSIDVYCQNIDCQNRIIEEDINFWSKFLKPGGIICGFGYSEEFPDVKNKVNNLSQFYQVEPVIVERFWCLVTDGDFEKLNDVAKVKEIHGYEYELEIYEPPALLAPGDFLKISGKLKNISGRDWNVFVDDVEVIKIGIQVYEENKSELQEFREAIGYDNLIDGAHIEFDFVLDTNQLKQGKIRLVFDVIAEGWYWFQDKGTKYQTVEVQILPRTAGNLNKVGNQLKRKGKLAEAIGEYRRAIELNPQFSWSYYNLGDALAKQGHINEAIAEYRKAIEINPKSAVYFYSLGKLLAHKGDISEAVVCYENTLKLKPDVYKNYKNLKYKALVQTTSFSTPNFHLKNKANVLVSTSCSFMIVNLYSGEYEVTESDNGVYYGITYSQNEIYVAARKGYEEEREVQDGEIIMYDFNKQRIGKLKAPFPLRDIHQIQSYNSLLWVTCSFDNKVAIYDGKKWHEWFPNPDKKYDSNHFNSIYFEGDYIYLVAHNIHRKSEVWKFFISQENYCNGFNVSDIKFIEKTRLGTWSHNIWLTDDDLYTCSSGELAIASKNKFFLKLGKFTRGLAVTDELIIVGLSELSERKQRCFSTSYIAVFDRKWNLINGLIMPEQGVINELRIPGYKDYCSPFYLGKKIKMFSDNVDLPRWKTFDNLKDIQN